MNIQSNPFWISPQPVFTHILQLTWHKDDIANLSICCKDLYKRVFSSCFSLEKYRMRQAIVTYIPEKKDQKEINQICRKHLEEVEAKAKNQFIQPFQDLYTTKCKIYSYIINKFFAEDPVEDICWLFDHHILNGRYYLNTRHEEILLIYKFYNNLKQNFQNLCTADENKSFRMICKNYAMIVPSRQINVLVSLCKQILVCDRSSETPFLKDIVDLLYKREEGVPLWYFGQQFCSKIETYATYNHCIKTLPKYRDTPWRAVRQITRTAASFGKSPEVVNLLLINYMRTAEIGKLNLFDFLTSFFDECVSMGHPAYTKFIHEGLLEGIKCLVADNKLELALEIVMLPAFRIIIRNECLRLIGKRSLAAGDLRTAYLTGFYIDPELEPSPTRDPWEHDLIRLSFMLPFAYKMGGFCNVTRLLVQFLHNNYTERDGWMALKCQILNFFIYDVSDITELNAKFLIPLLYVFSINDSASMFHAKLEKVIHKLVSQDKFEHIQNLFTLYKNEQLPSSVITDLTQDFTIYDYGPDYFNFKYSLHVCNFAIYKFAESVAKQNPKKARIIAQLLTDKDYAKALKHLLKK